MPTSSLDDVGDVQPLAHSKHHRSVLKVKGIAETGREQGGQVMHITHKPLGVCVHVYVYGWSLTATLPHSF